jgi:hypothetical protein
MAPIRTRSGSDKESCLSRDSAFVLTLDHKERALREGLASLRSLLVAYSGGTDSAYLA